MKRLNPCKLKGQYLDRGRSGRRGLGGFLQKLGCCECAKPFFAHGSRESEFLRYKMQAKAGDISFAPTAFDETEIKGETFSVPCTESFRALNSVGTRRFKRALKGETKFTGCESIEMDLAKNGEIVHFQREESNSFLDSGGGDDPTPGNALTLTAFARLNLGQRLSTLRDSYPEQEVIFDDEASTGGALSPELTMKNLMSARPADLRTVAIMKLYEEGAFDEHGEEVKATAYLVIKGISQKSFIKTAFTKYPVEKFRQLEKQVLKIYRENRTRDEIIFEKFNRSLTTKQRKALQLVYMDEEPKTQAEAAKQLGISVETLKDRIRGGIDKLKKAFPEYAPLTRGNSAANFETDLNYDGLYRKSSARAIHPIKRFNSSAGLWEPIDMEGFMRSRKQQWKRVDQDPE